MPMSERGVADLGEMSSHSRAVTRIVSVLIHSAPLGLCIVLGLLWLLSDR